MALNWKRLLFLGLLIVITTFIITSATRIAVWRRLAHSDGYGITEPGYAKIRKGMRRDQVEVILGGPPGDYGPGIGINVDLSTGRRWSFAVEEKEWLSNDLAIVVTFCRNGRVVHKNMTHSVFRPKQKKTFFNFLRQKFKN